MEGIKVNDQVVLIKNPPEWLRHLHLKKNAIYKVSAVDGKLLNLFKVGDTESMMLTPMIPMALFKTAQ